MIKKTNIISIIPRFLCLAFLSILFIPVLHAQLWQHAFLSEMQRNYKQVLSNDGDNFYLFGQTCVKGEPEWSGIMSKMDMNGKLLWTKPLANFQLNVQAVLTEDKSFLLAGKTKLIEGKQTTGIMKVNLEGEIIWFKTITGGKKEIFHQILPLKQSETYALISKRFGSRVRPNEMVVYTINSDGKVLETMTVPIEERINNVHCLFELDAKHFLLSFNTDEEEILLKIDRSTHQILEQIKKLGENRLPAIQQITKNEKGDMLAIGEREKGFDVINISTKGELTLLQSYESALSPNINDLLATTDQNFLLLGHQASGRIRSFDFYLLKVDKKGQLVWAKTYGDQSSEHGKALCQTKNNGLLLVGSRNSGGMESPWDMTAIKTDKDGNTDERFLIFNEDNTLYAKQNSSLPNVNTYYESPTTLSPNPFLSPANTIFKPISYPRSVLAADFDQDEKKDLLATLERGKLLNWYPQQDLKNPITICENCPEISVIKIVDLNEDGFQDIIAGLKQEAKLVWFRNNKGIFQEAQVLAENIEEINVIKPLDFDHDGDTDIMLGSSSEMGISWIENKTNGQFGQLKILSTQINSFDNWEIRDFDGNGDWDFFLRIRDYERKGHLEWYEYVSATQSFVAKQSFIKEKASTNEKSTAQFCMGDFKKNNRLELITKYSTDQYFLRHEWSEKDKNFQLLDTLFFQSRSKKINRIHAIDIDNDDDLDLLMDSPGQYWLKNDNGIFVDEKRTGSRISVSSDQYMPFHTDLDNDGDLDFIVSFENYHISNRYIYEANRDTFIRQQLFQPVLTSVKKIDVIDKDNDSFPDILITGGSRKELVVFDNTKALGISPDFTSLVGEIAGIPPMVGDFDGDKDPDIIIQKGTKNLYYLQNTGKDSTNWPISLHPITSTYNPLNHSYDIDNDGDTDILSIENASSIVQYDNLDGKGNFEKKGTLGVRGVPIKAVHLGDYNKNDAVDLIFGSHRKQGVGVIYDLKNQKGYHPNFLNVEWFGKSLIKPTKLNLIDIDNDGKKDIIGQEKGKHNIFVIKNGESTFLLPKFAKPFNDFVFHDLDHDGDEDIICGGNTLIWYKNQGGNFLAHESFYQARKKENFRSLLIEDMNQDGIKDLVAILNTGHLMIFFGK